MRFSASRASTYMSCGYMAYLKYHKQVPDTTNAKATFGSIIHHVLEDVETRRPTVAEAKKLFIDLWTEPEKLHLEYGRWPKFTNFAGLREKGYEILDTYYAQRKWEEEEIIALEHKFLVPFGDHELTGYVDKLSLKQSGTGKGLLLVTDYKQLAVDTPVLTPSGWTKLVDIKVGDEVIGVDGVATRVTGYADKGFTDAYRVTFDDGAAVVCSHDHRWTVSNYLRPEEWEVRQLSDLYPLKARSNNRWFIPTVEAVTFTQQDPLPLDPYLLGVLIGDGSFREGKVGYSKPDQEIANAVSAALPPGDSLSGGPKDWKVTGGATKRALLVLGLMGVLSPDRFIPATYLTAPIADRKRLLAGLMDTDGCSSHRTQYSTTSPRLRDDLMHLCRSLGGLPRFSGPHPGWYTTSDGERHEARDWWHCSPVVPFNPFTLKRKAEGWRPRKNRINRFIVSVERVPDQRMACIQVADPCGLYVIEDFVVTHNTASRKPSLAELVQNLQFTIYTYASTQREFWMGNGPDFPPIPNGEWWYTMLEVVPRRAIWHHLWTGVTLDAGDRDDGDYGRLYRLISQIERAIDNDALLPTLSGDTCTYCSYVNGACPTKVPTREEQVAQPTAWL